MTDRPIHVTSCVCHNSGDRLVETLSLQHLDMVKDSTRLQTTSLRRQGMVAFLHDRGEGQGEEADVEA